MDIVEHKSVLLEEALAALQVKPGGRYVDCTLGGGGHAFAILEQSAPGGRLLGIDADPAAIDVAAKRLKPFAGRAVLVNDNFRNLAGICRKHDFSPVDGILFDLGFSSFQIGAADRGFSFQQDAPLDMRFNPDQTLTAADIVNTYSEPELARILGEYGEERHSRRLARFIVKNRPLRTTLELAGVVEKALGRTHGRIHPATRTFQALRIAVNQELESLQLALDQVPTVLTTGGRVAVISFHSLEDRIVKEFFRRESSGCLCSPQTPACVCGHAPALRIITRKPVTPTPDEVAANPRSRSAKLRAAERI